MLGTICEELVPGASFKHSCFESLFALINDSFRAVLLAAGYYAPSLPGLRADMRTLKDLMTGASPGTQTKHTTLGVLCELVS